MEQIGKVLSVNGEMVNLEVKRMSACGSSCDSCHGTCEVKAEYISLPNLVNAKEGDFVEIYSDTGFILKSMMKVYGIPLGLFILSIVGSTYLGVSQLQALMLGISSFAVSFGILKILDKKSETNHSLEITRVL